MSQIIRINEKQMEQIVMECVTKAVNEIAEFEKHKCKECKLFKKGICHVSPYKAACVEFRSINDGE